MSKTEGISSENKSLKLYIETMGCPKNFNDSEGIGGIWEKAGMRLTEAIEDADVILVNTCGFINDAKKESIDKIFEMARFIEASDGVSAEERKSSAEVHEDSAKTDADPDKARILIVSGCLSERYGKELFAEMPEVDIFLGVNDYERLPQIVKAFKKGERQEQFSCQPQAFAEFSARKISDNPYSVTLRIAEGCNNCCAYCVIPQIRGSYRSRPAENILQEAEELAAKGCKEVILIAQDVTEYGRDLYGELKLPELLRRLCKIDGLRWIRLMYCYEDKITDELIEVMASEKKICHYIDIPLQHISDHVLKAMNRKSTQKSIENTILRLRTAIPDIHIRTTLITGFPGESEGDFEQLVDFVERVKFERLGVFAYSREEGTVAGDREDQIDEEVKAQRADAIMRRQIDISREINEAKVGNTIDVLVESIDEEGAYIGRSMYDAPEIDNTVIFRSDRETVAGLISTEKSAPIERLAPALPAPGDFVKVKVTDAFDYDIVGRTEE